VVKIRLAGRILAGTAPPVVSDIAQVSGFVIRHILGALGACWMWLRGIGVLWHGNRPALLLFSRDICRLSLILFLL
jgi:hypothetical protein